MRIPVAVLILVAALAAPLAASVGASTEKGAPNGGPRSSAPHAGLPCVIEIGVSSRVVEWVVMAEQITAFCWSWSADDRADEQQLLNREVEILTHPIDEAQAESLRTTIGGRILQDCRFSIDGRAVRPSIASVLVPKKEDSNFPGTDSVEFVFRMPVTERPDTVGIEWGVWERVVFQDQRRIPIQFKLEDVFSTVQTLAPEEPGYTWHYVPEEDVELAPIGVVQVREPRPYVVPVLSLVCLFLAIGLAVSGYFAKRARPVLSVLVVILATTAFLGRSVWTLEIPVHEETVILPTDREAVEIFATLHRNLYTAFDAKKEQQIYDRLQSTVTSDLVRPLYLEIHETLVMRNEAGAVCEVQGVRETEHSVFAEPQPWLVVDDALEGRPRFDIEWAWEAEGRVAHWGHEHFRTNIHRAEFAVVHDGRSWKIAAMETREHDRKDRDG